METGPCIIHIVGHIAALILFILLVKMLKFSKKDFSKEKNCVTETKKYFGIFKNVLFDMESSKLLNYLTNMY
jgi:hypothetical protein